MHPTCFGARFVRLGRWDSQYCNDGFGGGDTGVAQAALEKTA